MVFASSASAVPYVFNQQGVLRNNSNNELINGTHIFNLTVYNVTNNTILFSGLQSLYVSNGIYNLLWGNFSAHHFYGDAYFRFKIDQGQQFQRIDFTSVPYSLVAETAKNVSCVDIHGANSDLCSITPGAGALNWTNYAGTDLSGVDGAVGRQLVAAAEMVLVDNSFLHPNLDYTRSGNTITFLNPMFNAATITVWTHTGLSFTNYVGSNLQGISGSVNRILTHSSVQKIVIDNALLHPNLDYTYNTTSVVFANSVWDDQTITVWS